MDSPRREGRSVSPVFPLVFGWFGWLSVFLQLISFFQLSLLYRQELGLDDGGVTQIKSAALAATGLGGFVFGRLADRLGRKPSLVGSLLLAALGTLAAGTARNLAGLTTCAAIAGFGIGGQWAAGQMLLGESVPARTRGRFGALAQSGSPLGLGIATVLATQVAPHIGWRPAFRIAALPGLVAPLALWFLPESPVWRAHRDAIARGDERAPRIADLAAPGVRGPFALAFVLTLFNMANYWLAFSWLPEYLGRQWHLAIQRTGMWTLVFVSGALIGYVLHGVISDRWSRRGAFAAFSAVMAIGLLMITVFQSAIRDHPPVILSFLFITGVGTGTWSGFGPLYTELFPTAVRNTAAGVCMNVTRGIQVLAPFAVVAVGGQALGPGVALAAAFAVAAGAWVWLLPETRARQVGISLGDGERVGIA